MNRKANCGWFATLRGTYGVEPNRVQDCSESAVPHSSFYPGVTEGRLNGTTPRREFYIHCNSRRQKVWAAFRDF